jgi:GTPase SAR1 family protein
VPELRHHSKTCPDAKMYLIGTKSDLRNTGKDEISVDEANAMCKKLNLDAYVETSALECKVRHAFESAIVSMLVDPLENEKKKVAKCWIQ